MRPISPVLLHLCSLWAAFWFGLCQPILVAAAGFADVEISLYPMGALPSDRGLFAQRGTPSDTRITNGVGAGFKFALFPHAWGDILGVGLESSGHGNEISFTSLTQAGAPASTNVWIFNSMVNVILRYPGKTVVPYLGIGGGLSSAMLTHGSIPGRSDRDLEGSWAFGSQVFGGMQGNLGEHLFLFSEYKYFWADYHWKQLALDFRSQYVLAGIGLRF